MINFQGFPSGCWNYDNNGRLVRTNFRNSLIFAQSGIPVLSHEPYELVVPNNNNAVVDLSAYQDIELGNRNIAAKLATNEAYNDYLLTSGLNVPTGPSYVIPFNGGSQPVPPNAGLNGSVVIMPNFGPSNVTNPFAPNNGNHPQIGGGNQAGSANLTAPDSENYAALLTSRLNLIEKYCDKYGKTVDVDEIKSKYKNNPEAGVEYCDDILNNKFNQIYLRKLVHKEYDAYNKARQNTGKEVSDTWVDAVLKGGLDSLDISSGGVSKRNILDVIGAFALNKEVKNGKVSLENVFESPQMTSQLIDVLKSRADEALLDKNVKDTIKSQISAKIESLVENYGKYVDSLEDDDKHNDIQFKQVRALLAKNYIELFALLRRDEAEKNDAIAPQYYGLPESSSIKFNDQVQRATEEVASYKHRKKLSTSI